ncbi:hypothetical protein F5X99DRAFT_414386 [Biscogniauxia marginata]|nr:hypothetical protein F5X99DRAFT_414386 [Biscogniauxia marginata]
MVEPKYFYRVQWCHSFTFYDNPDGFAARGHYWMDYSHWLNKNKIEHHLNWKDRSEQPTPFISIFDNRRDAEERARHLANRGQRDVFIAEIHVPRLQSSTLEIVFGEKTVRLPALLHVDDDSGVTTFISTFAVQQHLGVDVRVSQRSEWFALDYIPGRIVTRISIFGA